jgi:hypothetical protein
LSQFPKRLVTFLGGVKPKVISIMRQINWANGHSRDMCCMDSLLSQEK